MDLTAAAEGEPIRFGQDVDDADAQPIPLVGVHPNDLILLAISINLSVDTGHHEKDFVGGPVGSVGIDHLVILDDEHTVGTTVHLWLGKAMMVGMIPVRAAGMVVGDIPYVIEAVTAAVYVTGYIVTISSADNVKATVGNEWVERRREVLRKEKRRRTCKRRNTTHEKPARGLTACEGW